MIKKLIVIILILLGMSIPALSNFAIFQLNSGVIPPTCSNSLVFSDGCNSQYIPTI